jgi:hypothetical protein
MFLKNLNFIFLLQFQKSLKKIREVFFLNIFLNIHSSNIVIQTSSKCVSTKRGKGKVTPKQAYVALRGPGG